MSSPRGTRFFLTEAPRGSEGGARAVLLAAARVRRGTQFSFLAMDDCTASLPLPFSGRGGRSRIRERDRIGVVVVPQPAEAERESSKPSAS